ncbi:MAG: phosphoglycerate dehydrogenase [Candidatus Brocadiia bacterium]
MKVLVSDSIAPEALDRLKGMEGLTVDFSPGLSPQELAAHLADAEGIIIRSGTKLTAEALAAAPRLRAVVRAGVGVDNVDVAAASRRGIIVMNTPGGNTVSTAEQTMALLLGMSRNTYPACRSLKAGQWERKKFMGSQLAGKSIGIIGLGRIGLEVARRANAFGMKAVGFDPYVSAERAKDYQVAVVGELDELLAAADYISLHVPHTDETHHMLGPQQFAKMKDGVRVLNCARGGVVDEAALAEAVRSGKVAGAALDVYEQEPPTHRELLEMEQVLCTPHLGASTEEAQLSVAMEAVDQMADALLRGRIRNAVNVPAMEPSEAEALAPYCELGRDLGLLHTHLVRQVPQAVEVVFAGEAAKLNSRIITAHVLAGILDPVLEEELNYINAPYLAEERGIRFTESRTPHTENFTAVLSLRSTVDGEEHEMAGTIVGKGEPRIVVVDGYRVEAMTRGPLLVIFAEDKPGLIGNVGHVLGQRGINIAAMTFGRRSAGGQAITVLNLDVPADEAALEAIRAIPHVRQARSVTF